MKTSGFLRAAQAVIADPTAWAQGDAAFDKNGKPVHIYSGQAVCYCMMGAIGLVVGSTVGINPDYEKLKMQATLKDAIIRKQGWADPKSPIAHFNDAPYTTHADVMQVFNDAIYLAEQAGS